MAELDGMVDGDEIIEEMESGHQNEDEDSELDSNHLNHDHLHHLDDLDMDQDLEIEQNNPSAKECVKEAAEQLMNYMIKRGKEHLTTKKLGEMDDVELYEVMCLCKSTRERIKYGVKLVRGGALDGRAMLTRNNSSVNRYKLEVFKNWIASNSDMVETSLCNWSTKRLRELITKAYRCSNLHRVPKKVKDKGEENDLIEGRPAIGCSTSSYKHNTDQPSHELEGNQTMTMEHSILSDLQFIRLSMANLRGRIDAMERRLDEGLPVPIEMLSMSKNLLISLLQQIE